MGSYLSEPVLEKQSADEIGDYMSYGSSSMQGWRVSQEDAHNNILGYMAGKSMFAVYDGHGGHEVAEYCSQYLPDYIKQNPDFLAGNYERALEDCFIGFDATLVDRKVVAKLKAISGADEKEDEEEAEEVNHLCEEASMPIEAVIAKYNSDGSGGDSEPSKPVAAVNPALAHLKAGASSQQKPISPFLRAKKGMVPNSDGDQNGGPPANKHIRFNEDGCEIKENGVVKDVADTGTDEKLTKDNSGVTVNGNVKTDTEAAVAATENGVKDEAEAAHSPTDGSGSPDGSVAEKENKDTNSSSGGGVTKSEVGAVLTETDLKGKGKGKGKGKSSRGGGEATAAVAVAPKAEKKRKSASEIYTTLLNDPESGDEDSDDSEDAEFGAEIDSDESDDEEVDGEATEDSDEDVEDEDEDSNLEDEDDEEEECMIDVDYTEEPGNDSGCTAVLALVAGTKLFVANAGDSRCVVCREDKALEMSADHKPEDEIELNRIQTAGGKVTPDGRVNGGLNLSRAIGDHAYKQNATLPLKDQMISCQPDVKVIDLDPAKDSWMILACDGIWNSMTSQEVVDFVNERIADTSEDKLSSICEQLFDRCLAPDTTGDGTGCDNMTAIIVKFKPSLSQNKDVLTPLPPSEDVGSSSSSGSSSSVNGGGSGSSSSKTAGISQSASEDTTSAETTSTSEESKAKTSIVDSSAAVLKRSADDDETDDAEALPSGKKLKLDSTAD